MTSESTFRERESSGKLIPIELAHGVEGSGLRYSDYVPLNSEILPLDSPGLRVLELSPDKNSELGVSGLFLFSGQREKPQPIGYVVFGWKKDADSKALLSINLAKTKRVKNNVASLPEDIAQAIEQGDLFDAFRLDPSVRGKGVGKALGLIAVAYMRDLGFNQIEISGDVTIGKQGGAGTFYESLGASFDPDTGKEVILTDSSVLNAEYLRKLFEPEKNKSIFNPSQPSSK